MTNNSLKELTQLIDSLALDTVMLDPEDVTGLGEALKSLESIEIFTRDLKEKSLISIIGAMKGYIEKLILREKSDLSPFESGISQLQEICRDLINGKAFSKDISSLLTNLGYMVQDSEAQGLEGSETEDAADETSQSEREKETPEGTPFIIGETFSYG
ncbi:MAG: hypothetical protein JRF08_08240 [Deltaproteobacteria bacterium]|nr:hypothetical protein [Deltaproteobacteria bacterium]